MKWQTMSSPTPSVDSLMGGPNLGSFLEGGDSGLGLELHNGCHGSSSSSSTCSSIIFPHLSISNGVLSNGYGGSPEHLRGSGGGGGGDFNGLSSPIGSVSSGQASSKCGICHDSLSRPKVHHTFCQDCLEKNNDGEDRIVSPVSWETCQGSQSYSGTLDLLKSFETASSRLQSQYMKAQNEITEAFAFYRTLLDERKNELLKELESLYMTRQVTLSVVTQRVQETLDRMYQAVEFGDRLLRDASPPQVLVFKKLLETRLQVISATVPEPSLAMAEAAAGDMEFVANFSAMQTAVRNTLGYIRSGGIGTESVSSIGKQSAIAPIARPIPSQHQSQQQQQHQHQQQQQQQLQQQQQHLVNGYHGNHHLKQQQQQNGIHSGNGITNGQQPNHLPDSSSLSKRITPTSTSNTPPTLYNQIDLGGLSTYEKWSNASEASYQNGHKEFGHSNGVVVNNEYMSSGGGSQQGSQQGDSLLDLTSKLMAPLSFSKNPGIKRQKMIYHCKFGEFGTAEAQFTEPSGVTVNANSEIIVADTNNHRIQIFDREGRFKFQFGECGKRDGQLLYPNRVAVVKPSGDIVVTERSPTHQIQIYNQYGQFVRKFGANILQHPRGVTVDSKGRIIVVECKVMRVIIFDQMGTVLHKFGCSKHLEFPNGVVVNDRQEIFISDNRAHCVKVFNYEGVFLRQIGGEGLTNYPIGVGINANGEILVADNHNNFNLTIFTQEGQLVSALESKVKHAQCFDVALMDDGSVVLASKDYRLYIYRYVQVPPIGL